MSDYEVELKFPLTDRDSLAASLKSIGAKRLGEVTQADKYFSHPVRKFEQTDEALRLRSEGDANCLTYKGPLLDRTTKTRQELELALADGAEDAHKAWAILRALGFEDVYTVRKHRTTYAVDWEGRQFTLAVDRVEDLGDYVEIETLASAHNWEPARDAAQRLAEQLHLTPSERRSYLQLLLERHRRPTP